MLGDWFDGIVDELLPESDRRAPRWVWFLLAALSFGAALFFWYRMDESFWTWPALLLSAVLVIAGFFGSS